MAHCQNQYGAVPQQTHGNDDPNRQTDEFSNPVVQTDEYSIPVHPTGTVSEGFDSGMRGHGGAPAAGTGLDGGHHHGLHRSGSSSSSSSSEDDGEGGRRKKKGLKKKIKRMVPGVGHKDNRSNITATTTPGGYNITGEGQEQKQKQKQQQHEKKGVMKKIKEKLPGHHHH